MVFWCAFFSKVSFASWDALLLYLCWQSTLGWRWLIKLHFGWGFLFVWCWFFLRTDLLKLFLGLEGIQTKSQLYKRNCINAVLCWGVFAFFVIAGVSLFAFFKRWYCGGKLCILPGCLLLIHNGALFLMGSLGADAMSIIIRKIWDGMWFLQTLCFWSQICSLENLGDFVIHPHTPQVVFIWGNCIILIM